MTSVTPMVLKGIVELPFDALDREPSGSIPCVEDLDYNEGVVSVKNSKAHSNGGPASQPKRSS